MTHSRYRICASVLPLLAALAVAAPAAAQEWLCDDSFEDCRASIIQMIRTESAGLDVSFWVMTDTRYSTEIIKRWQAGVPVRILLDLRSDQNYPAGATVRQSLINAGIPIRHKTTTGINHWKMILYSGQNSMHFSAANFANGSYSPVVPYTNYVDEAIYFTADPDVVHSFMTKFDDLWTNTTHYANLANVGALVRNYPTYPMDPELNFPPDQDYQDRLVAQMKLETQQIDVAMFRITSGKVPDEMIRRRLAGVPIRLITDQQQYRNPTYFWDSYNVDRMYAAGVLVKWKVDDSGQDMHQKSVLLYGRGLTIFGSSNWTSSSSDKQREHNYFTTKPSFFDWFVQQFDRKWNNKQIDGSAISPPMFVDFVPGWPEPPVNASPANQALGQSTSATLKWEGGWWAHKYDIYFGTTNPPPLIASNYMPGSATAGVSSNKESFNPCAPPAGFTSVCPSGLAPGTTYYWYVRGKTMLGDVRAITGPMWSFTTSGGVPPPPAPTGLVGQAVSPTRIALAWNDVEGEEGYKLERKLASSSTWTQIAQLPADSISPIRYENTTGLTANTTYNYRVRAFTSGGNSGYSNTITVSTLATSPETARIVADAYIQAGTSAGTNFGRATELITKGSADPRYMRQAYLKLDISQFQAGQRATLQLLGRLSDTRASSVMTEVVGADNTSWSETAVTWNNNPGPLGPNIDSIMVSGTTSQWYTVDITSYVELRRSAGATTVTIGLICGTDMLPYISFASRESANSPQLIFN